MGQDFIPQDHQTISRGMEASTNQRDESTEGMIYLGQKHNDFMVNALFRE